MTESETWNDPINTGIPANLTMVCLNQDWENGGRGTKEMLSVLKNTWKKQDVIQTRRLFMHIDTTYKWI